MRVTSGNEVRVPRWVLMKRFLCTTLIVILILYVAALLISRTDGFRHFVEEQVGTQLGMALTIEKLSLSPNLALSVMGVQLDADVSGAEAGLTIGKAKIGWSLKGALWRTKPLVLSIWVRDGTLTFAMDRKGQWQPAAFAPVGNWLTSRIGLGIEPMESSSVSPGSASRSNPSSVDSDSKTARKGDFSDWSDLKLRVGNGRVTWLGPDGREIALADGMQLQISPIILPERKLSHLLLRVDRARMRSGKYLNDVVLEMLKTEDSQILLAFDARWGTTGRSEFSVPELQAEEAPQIPAEPRTVKQNNVTKRERIRRVDEDPGPGSEKDLAEYLMKALVDPHEP